MSPRPLLSAVVLLALSSPLPLSAQQPAAPKNLVSNGDFERALTRDNIWDGVDGDGYLAGSRMRVPALAETGLQPIAMPVSVRLVDMNADQLPDMVTADPLGYFRIYFNSGTPAEPKFTVGEILPLFFWNSTKWSGPSRRSDVLDERNYLRRVPKIDLADWTGRGSKDLIVGFYGGEIAVIPNSGSASNPLFSQPRKVDSQLIPTTATGRKWGNLFAPLAVDWNGDRQMDLLLGEGSYSANAVHVLINSGSSSAPKFTDEGRFYLAYGMGREHLHPALGDFNGDGSQDLLISDRQGEISLYLNKAGTWKPGDQLDFTSVVSLGGASTQRNLISLSTGDYNGDGKLDILMGKTNGRIGVALNTGSLQEPKFGPVAEIKGTDFYKREIKLPSGWDIDTGETSGHAFAVVTAVDAATDPAAAPPQGKSALKAFYQKPVNQVVPAGIVENPAIYPDATERYGYDLTAEDVAFESGTRTISMIRSLPNLTPGVSYELSFKAKGNAIRNATYVVGYHGFKKLAPDKVTQRGRGVQIQRFEEREDVEEAGRFSPGPAWSEVTKSFRVSFKNRELKDVPANAAKLIINFELASWDSVLYLDDVSIVQK